MRPKTEGVQRSSTRSSGGSARRLRSGWGALACLACGTCGWGVLAEVTIGVTGSATIEDRAAVTVVSSSPQLSTLLVTASALGTTALTLPGPAVSGGSGSPMAGGGSNAGGASGGSPGAGGQGFAGGSSGGLEGALSGGLGGFSASGALSGDAISLDTGIAGPPPGGGGGIRVPQVIAQFN